MYPDFSSEGTDLQEYIASDLLETSHKRALERSGEEGREEGEGGRKGGKGREGGAMARAGGGGGVGLWEQGWVAGRVALWYVLEDVMQEAGDVLLQQSLL